MRENRHNQFSRPSGFTLVELMVTLVIAFVITGAAYSAYIVQQKNYTVQEQVARVQQNIRAGLEIMTREMRMAGYDPTMSGRYGVIAANSSSFQFTADLCEDGGDPDECTVSHESIKEIYHYELYKPPNAPADYPFSLRRTPDGSAIADHIEMIEFQYTLRNGSKTTAPTPMEYGRIEAVEISILARSPQKDHRYTDTGSYTTASGMVINPGEKNYHRRMLRTTLQLRNLGYRI